MGLLNSDSVPQDLMIARRLAELSLYGFKLKYVKRASNGAADYLSRVFVMREIEPDLLEGIGALEERMKADYEGLANRRDCHETWYKNDG